MATDALTLYVLIVHVTQLTGEDHDHRDYFSKNSDETGIDDTKMPSPVQDSMWSPGLCSANHYQKHNEPVKGNILRYAIQTLTNKCTFNMHVPSACRC